MHILRRHFLTDIRAIKFSRLAFEYLMFVMVSNYGLFSRRVFQAERGDLQ